MKAMILAAGLGTRLKPLTEETAKPLVPIVNKPVMEHTLELLAGHGITELFVNIHYHADAMRGHFGDGSRWGVSLTWSYEEELLGTAGGVKKLERDLADDDFLVISGDALTDIDLTALAAYHRAKGGVATLVLTPVDDPSIYGVVLTDEDGRITGFQEKPSRAAARSHLANSGIYVFSPEALADIPAGAFYDFGSQLFPRWMEEGRAFYGFFHDDYWNDVGSIEEYRRGNFDALEGKVRVNIPGAQVARDIWVGDDTEIDEGVLMVGPLCIGSRCRVRRGARLYGPLIIGDDTEIDEGAVLYRGIKWGRGYVGKDANLMDSVVGFEARIGGKASLLAGTVIGHRTSIGEGTVIHPGVRIVPGTVIDGCEEVTE